MTVAVWKYPIQLGGHTRHLMPEGAKVIFAATQYNQPCIWAEVDVDAPKVGRTFFTFGTGWEIPDQEKLGRYVGSFLIDNGQLVQHCYEQ